MNTGIKYHSKRKNMLRLFDVIGSTVDPVKLQSGSTSVGSTVNTNLTTLVCGLCGNQI